MIGLALLSAAILYAVRFKCRKTLRYALQEVCAWIVIAVFMLVCFEVTDPRCLWQWFAPHS